MGLDKRKPILVRDDFKVDPFQAVNQSLSAQQRTTLPTQPDDVILDKGQSLFYSVEYALKRLLQNDEFAENFFKKSSSQVELAVDAGLLTSQNVVENMATPQSTGIYKQYYDRHLQEYHGKDRDSIEHSMFEGGVADCMISDVA